MFKMNYNITSNFSKDGTIVKICLGASYFLYSPSSNYISHITAACVANALRRRDNFEFYIFWKSSRMRSNMFYFTIMVLSSIDLSVVTIVQPLASLQQLNKILFLTTLNCVSIVLTYLASCIFCGMSLSTLFTINIERYFSIVRPILHRTMFTKRRFLLTCSLGWLVISSMITSQVFSRIVGLFAISVVLFMACSTSLFVYFSIFLFARKRLLTVNTQGNKDNDNNSKQLASFLRELKMAKTYVLIVSLSFICYLPYGVSVIYYDIGGSVAEQKVKWEKGITGSVTMLVYMNSSLNCLVFFWMNRELRKEGSKIVNKYFSNRDGT